MYCGNCGTEAKEGAKFCTACGAPIVHDKTLVVPIATEKESQAQLEAEGIAEAMQEGQRRSRGKMSPLVLIALILALMTGTALATYFVYTEVYVPYKEAQNASQQMDVEDSSHEPVVEESSDEKQDESAEAEEDTTTKASEILNDINGWWGPQGSNYDDRHKGYYYNIHDGEWEWYSIDLDHFDNYHYSGSGTIIMPTKVEGVNNEVDSECYKIQFDGRGSYFYYYPSNNNLLECRWDGGGYSGTDSLMRLDGQPSFNFIGEDNPVPEDSGSSSHVTAGSFEFDIPKYWEGRVWVDIASENEVYIRSNESAEAGVYLVSITRLDSDFNARTGGDVSSSLHKSGRLDDGTYLAVRCVAPQLWFPPGQGVGNLPGNVSYEEYAELLDLATGGLCSVDNVNTDASSRLIKAPIMEEFAESVFVTGHDLVERIY